jgi:tRNA (guanine37-N1)-methyltransferase
MLLKNLKKWKTEKVPENRKCKLVSYQLALLPMRFDIITIHPELLSGPFSHSILKRAQDKGLVAIHFHDLRNYTLDKHKKVDDYAFGGGAGMVMQIEPIDRCISKLQSDRDYDEVILYEPRWHAINSRLEQ